MPLTIQQSNEAANAGARASGDSGARAVMQSRELALKQYLAGQQIDAEKAAQERGFAHDLAKQAQLHGSMTPEKTESVRNDVPMAATNQPAEGMPGPYAQLNDLYTKRTTPAKYNPGLMGQEKMMEHTLSEQGAMNRFSQADKYASAHPNMGISISKEGTSLTPKPKETPLAMQLTPGQETADKAFGKDYADYIAGGGRAGVDKNLKQLEDTKDDLKNTTWFEQTMGGAPKLLRDYLTPKAVAREDMVKNSVQATLRQTLGAQFTEREGNMLMDRAYNPRLSPEENIKRVTAIAKELRDKADQKERTGALFEKTGSIKGLNAARPQAPAQRTAPGSGGLSPSEQAELDQLREEMGK